MKVYMKKENYQSFYLGVMVMVFLFMVAIVGSAVMLRCETLEEAVGKYGILIPFILIFAGAGIRMLIGMFEAPREYQAKLVKKEIGQYVGKPVTQMVFKLVKNEGGMVNLMPDYYPCYSYEDNSLVVGRQYPVKIDRGIQKILEVIPPAKEVDEAMVESPEKKDCFENYTDGNIPQTGTLVEKPSMIRELLSVVVFWVVGSVFVVIMKQRLNMTWNGLEDHLILLGVFLVIVTIVLLFRGWQRVHYDEQKIRKIGLTNGTMTNVSSMQKYRLLTNNRDKIFVVDSYNQLVFITGIHGILQNRYVVYNGERKLIASVKRTIQLTGMKYYVDIEDRNGFSLEPVREDGCYDVDGLPYIIRGDRDFREAKIWDENDRDVVSIENTRNGEYEVTVNGVPNTLYLTLIATLTILGDNYIREQRRNYLDNYN
ncbi:MAG: hypothetical protein K6G64_09505 [Eubacterium sp.]|nr:hypothetical protein [Eubacterium sp.]